MLRECARGWNGKRHMLFPIGAKFVYRGPSQITFICRDAVLGEFRSQINVWELIFHRPLCPRHLGRVYGVYGRRLLEQIPGAADALKAPLDNSRTDMQMLAAHSKRRCFAIKEWCLCCFAIKLSHSLACSVHSISPTALAAKCAKRAWRTLCAMLIAFCFISQPT